MKNLARLIIALFATQLLIAGIASAAVSSASINQHSTVCATPDGEEPPDSSF